MSYFSSNHELLYLHIVMKPGYNVVVFTSLLLYLLILILILTIFLNIINVRRI